VKIAILGAGHMGGWLARILNRDHLVGVYDCQVELAGRIPGIEVFLEVGRLAGFVPDMLINAVSIQNTRAAFRESLPYLPEGCLLADVMSVKNGIRDYYTKCGFRFVSLHPMFGPTFANVDRLEEENAVIIAESDPGGKEFFRRLFQGFGINVVDYSFEEHDRKIAYSLTLPFASTLVFAANMDKRTVPGTTFRKHTLIAQGLLSEDDALLSEILFSPHSLNQLEKVTQRLEFLKHIIRQKDFEEAHRFFSRLRKNIGLESPAEAGKQTD